MSGHVISGLIRRRSELTGAICELLATVDGMANDLEALDRTLRMFAPGIDLQAIPALQHRPQPDWAIRGEVVRIIMAMLRGAGEPLSTMAIAAEVHHRRSLDGAVTPLHLKRVRKCLDRQRVNGTLARVQVGGEICWRIA